MPGPIFRFVVGDALRRTLEVFVNTCRIVEGRLLEINVADGYHKPEDVDAMMAMMKDNMARVINKQVIVFADWRRCGMFSEPVAERVRWMLTRDNPKVERSAILHNEQHKVLLLQVSRLIREGGHAHRRVFDRPDDVAAYLGEKLNLAERDRLEALLRPVAPR